MSLLNPGGGSSPSIPDLNQGKDSRLFSDFKGFIRKEKLFSKNASLLVAVSGGPDSVCLLNLIFLLSGPWSLRLAVAHFEHGLRGEESLRDAGFVQEICACNRIPFFLERADIRALARKKDMGLQEAARQARYSFLKRTAREQGLGLIATGHTRDDQAEEIVFRLARGAGPGGLAGIRIRREDGVIRPLLFCRKEKILEYLARYDISFVHDSSNQSLKYTRNRVRKVVLPVMEKEINPAAVDSIYKVGRIMAEENQAMETLAHQAYEQVSKGEGRSGGVFLDRIALSAFPRAVRRRVYRKAMAEAGLLPARIGFDHLEKMDELSCSSRPVALYSLPEGYFVLRNYGLVAVVSEIPPGFRKSGRVDEGFSLTVEEPGRFPLPAGAGEVVIEEVSCNAFGLETGGFFPRPVFVSLRETAFPFRLTFRRKGDRFMPLGQKHRVRLKKFLINRHVPRFMRDILPVLRKGEEITAVCGVETSQPARIMPGDSSCIRLIWNPGSLAAFFRGLKDSIPAG